MRLRWNERGRKVPDMGGLTAGLLSSGAESLYVPPGEMASDLYGPQFWDDNFQFSFSVVVSCKSNKQLGYF